MTSLSSARSLADVDRGFVLATVEIEAPPARVFQALTDPRELAQWWGSPETYRADRWVADLRVGGAWRVDGHSTEGKPYSVSGEFLEIDPPRKLVQTWKPDWVGEHPSTTITYRLDDIPGGTRVTVRHEGFVSKDACANHGKGWERVLGWLQAHLSDPAQPGL